MSTSEIVITDDAERACHDVLVRLAGRLPDRLLWRLRDWLAADGHAALSRALPKALLRNRIGVTEAERDLMEACLPAWGATQRQLDAVLRSTSRATPSRCSARSWAPRRPARTSPAWAAGGTAWI